jgi:hypothetical protein
MWTPELAADRLAGRTASSRLMLTISAGYFLYDAAVSIVRYEGVAYLLHGVVSCALYTYGALTGWLGYYGARAVPPLSLPSPGIQQATCLAAHHARACESMHSASGAGEMVLEVHSIAGIPLMCPLHLWLVTYVTGWCIPAMR